VSADGKPAKKPPRKPFLLRLSPELMAELKGWASQEFRSLNGHIEYLLQDAVRRRKGEGGGEGENKAKADGAAEQPEDKS
jgi:hypothetical protein